MQREFASSPPPSNGSWPGHALRLPPKTRHRSIAVSSSSSTRTEISKVRSIHKLECELAEKLVLTPYLLLLGIPGICVVSAAEFAGEAGPIEHYPTNRSISGRAGLYPGRYQSDEVDHCDGRLIRCANRSLRAAIMIIADNLLKCNEHFRVLAAGWRLKGEDPRDIHVKIAGRFCRIAYYMVAGRQVFQHPCACQRDYILGKLIKYLQRA